MGLLGKGSSCLLASLVLLGVSLLTADAQSGCGENFTAEVGQFSSPGYPAYHVVGENCKKGTNPGGRCYGCYTECVWTITVPEHMTVRLQIDEMDFTDLSACCRNYIDVRDGPTSTGSFLNALCGSTVPEPVYSTGNAMYIRLVSPAYYNRRHRFNATWTAECRRRLADASGTLQSVGFPNPYPADLKCTYIIERPRGFRISINFTLFSLDEPIDGNCSDTVKVYDGGSEDFPLLGGPYCGESLPGRLTSTSNTMYIQFHTDSSSGSGSLGFEADYTEILPECPASRLIEQQTGIITSPGFPEPFPQTGTCSWTIDVGDDCSEISVTFHTIELGPDTAQVLDCDSPAVKTEVSVYAELKSSNDQSEKILLARFCKRVGSPQTVLTKYPRLTVVYKSKDVSRPAAWDDNPVHGFNATYRTTKVTNGTRKEKPDCPSEGSDGLLPFSDFTEDSLLNKTGEINERTHVLRIGSGIPVGKSRYQFAYIRQDGQVGFSNEQRDPNILSSRRIQGACNERSYQSVCVQCTVINTSHSDSKIYFNLHKPETALTEPSKKIISEAKKTVARVKGSDDFDENSVLLVTWSKVRKGKETAVGYGDAYNGFAKFQVAITFNEREAYAILIYLKGNMNMQYPSGEDPNITVGITTIENQERDCQDLAISGTRSVLSIDKFFGNLGKQGVWVFKLGEAPVDATQACEAWFSRNSGQNKNKHDKGFEELPKCPCRVPGFSRGMNAYGIWVSTGKRTRVSGKPMYCFRLSRAFSETRSQFGKECCYDKEPAFRTNAMLIETQPDAGTATAYNPTFPQYYQQYMREDRVAHQTCCVDISSPIHCNNYYTLRPIGECEPRPSFRFAWLCCDPHITTLDEGEYTFNGWGEYTMVTLATSVLNFTLQARTDLAETETGKLSNATVFSAFGVEENGVRIFVKLDADTKTSLAIFANNEDFSIRFRDEPTFLNETNKFLIQRNNDTFEMAFPSGISLGVAVREKSLALSISIPILFQNQTRGLLGNFNGVNNDDFILPNGTVMASNLTERQIFETFGPAWAVTADNTVLRYGPTEDTSIYSHPEFVPVFLDEQTQEVKDGAKTICGNNLACMYDYVATGSQQIALSSKAVKENANAANFIIKDSVPQLAPLSPILVVTEGSTVNFTLKGNDADGDPITYHAVDYWNGSVQVNAVSGFVLVTMDDNARDKLEFFVRATNRARSEPQTITYSSIQTKIVIYNCQPPCTEHGMCNLNKTSTTQKIPRAECICYSAWDGEDCQHDKDGCKNATCRSPQQCRDLPAEEQGNSNIGFDCGDCVEGFANVSGQPYCVDVNECENNTLNMCQMLCFNTEGSYECKCQPGHRLNNDSKTCRDIDECQEKTDNCDQICSNTDGEYECRCEEGYSRDASTNSCRQATDLAAECSDSGCSQGCKRGTDPGSGTSVLECFCFAGYDNTTEDAAECEDHDECQDDVSVCSQGCVNSNGRFACTCYIGFQLADDKTTCLPCPASKYGPNCNFTCRCSGRAVRCDDVKGCKCRQGWRGDTCQDDVDECSETPNVCKSDQQCKNTQGSFTCSCRNGYSMDSTGYCTVQTTTDADPRPTQPNTGEETTTQTTTSATGKASTKTGIQTGTVIGILFGCILGLLVI